MKFHHVRFLVSTISLIIGTMIISSSIQAEQLSSKKMVVVAVEIVFEEGIIEDEGIRDAFRIMEQETRKEPGCIKYISSVDIHDSKIVRIDEVWESMETLNAHFKTPHMADFQKALSHLRYQSMTAKVYEINQELPFPN